MWFALRGGVKKFAPISIMLALQVLLYFFNTCVIPLHIVINQERRNKNRVFVTRTLAYGIHPYFFEQELKRAFELANEFKIKESLINPLKHFLIF